MPEQFLAPDPPAQQEQFLPPDSPLTEPSQQADQTQQNQAQEDPIADMIRTGTQAAASSYPALQGPGQTLENVVRQGPGQLQRAIDVAPKPSIPGMLYQQAGEHLTKGEYLKAAGTLLGGLSASVAAQDPLLKFIDRLVGAHVDQTTKKDTQPEKAVGQDPKTGKWGQYTVGQQNGTKPTTAKQPILKEAPPEIDMAIQQAAEKYDLPAKLIQAVVQAESNYNPEAFADPKKGGHGEKGLMQLMPETRAELGMNEEDAFDVEKNIDAGARWLRAKIDAHGGDIQHGVTAYNGSGAKAKEYASNVMALYASGQL